MFGQTGLARATVEQSREASLRKETQTILLEDASNKDHVLRDQVEEAGSESRTVAPKQNSQPEKKRAENKQTPTAGPKWHHYSRHRR